MSTDNTPLGVWLLRSYQAEDMETGRVMEGFGPAPRGVLMLHPGGRMVVLVTATDPKMPAGDADRTAACNNLLAYSGRYRLIPPDSFVTSVDVAWFAGFVATEQARTYRVDGDVLHIIAGPTRDPRPGGGMVRVTLIWDRERPNPD